MTSACSSRPIVLGLISLGGVVALLSPGCTSSTPKNTYTPTETASPTQVPVPTATPPDWLLVAGGDNGTTIDATVNRGQVSATGAIPMWMSGSPVPSPVTLAAAANDGGTTVYLLGGIGPTGPTGNVSAGTVSGSQVSSWMATTPLPTPMVWGAAATRAACLYYLGGTWNNAQGTPIPTSNVWMTQISGMMMTGWVQTTPMPAPVYAGYAWQSDSHLFVTGGLNSNGAANWNTYVGQLDAVGNVTGWTTTVSLSVPLHAYGTSAFADRTIYLFGGVGVSNLGVVGPAPTLAASVNSNGTIGTWSQGPGLPLPIALLGGCATSDALWAVGGAPMGPTGPGPSVGSIYRMPRTGSVLGSWTSAASLPSPRQGAAAFVIR